MLKSLFSDTYRWTKVFFAIILILILDDYATLTGPNTEISFNEITLSPQTYVGTTIPFAGKITAQKGQLTTLTDRGMQIITTGLQPSIPLGETISGLAQVRMLNNQPILKVTEYHRHKGRQLKVLTAPIVTTLVIIFFFYQYRFDFQHLVFEPRRQPK